MRLKRCWQWYLLRFSVSEYFVYVRICGEWLLYISNNFGGHLKCEGQTWSTFLTYGSANHFRLISNFIFYFSRKITAIMEHVFGCYQNFLGRSVRSVVLEISSLWICFNEIKKVKPGIDLLEFLGLALLSIVCSSLFPQCYSGWVFPFSGHVKIKEVSTKIKDVPLS